METARFRDIYNRRVLGLYLTDVTYRRRHTGWCGSPFLWMLI